MSKSKNIYSRVRFPVVILLICFSYTTYAQQMLVDLSSVDGMDITPRNILNYRIQYLGTDPSDVVVKGTIRYRSSDMRVAYSFRTKLQPGLNSFSSESVNPQYQFSSSALRELFQDHGVLPYGTYQYCVSVSVGAGGDGGQSGSDGCLFRKSEDQFMINLIDPEDDAKLYEYNPLLTWVANYSFSSLLTYRIRVAEIKDGQNTASAITRNNPVYQESGLMQNSIVYPVYGKPLQPFQPYAWTVDAYYKGILLGGAEPWKFMIVEDSTFVEVPIDQPYYEFNKHYGETTVSAVGELKLRYLCQSREDTLYLSVATESEQPVKIEISPRPMQFDENLFAVDLRSKLSHRKNYVMVIRTRSGYVYEVPFIYYNPLFVK